jgi:hypothetical protein
MTSSSAIYVVYLTSYMGNLLPPFYIGSSSLEKVQKGYNGSVTSIAHGATWRAERKEHPALFRTVILSEHESRQEALDAERALHEALGVVEHPFFINQAIAGIHPRNSGKGRKMSAKTRDALRAANVGKKHQYKPRAPRPPITDETRAKLSAAARARTPRKFSDEARQRIAEAAKKRSPPSRKCKT